MILAFDIWATLGSWGVPALSAGNVAHRETQLHPGKAAVAGILGAAMGIPRGDVPHFAGRFRTACRTDAMPSRLPSPDYESTRRSCAPQNWTAAASRTSRFEDIREIEKLNGGAPSGSILSTREYWSAGGWTVFVAAEQPLLEEMDDALRSPYYQVFVGRTCCSLAFPAAPALLPVDGLTEAVLAHRGLHIRIEDPILREAILQWRTVKSGVLHWEDGFPGVPPAMTRRLVRQIPYAVPQQDDSPRHRLRLFGEHVECSAPGTTAAQGIS